MKNDVIGGEEGDVLGLLTDLPSLRKLTGQPHLLARLSNPMGERIGATTGNLVVGIKLCSDSIKMFT